MTKKFITKPMLVTLIVFALCSVAFKIYDQYSKNKNEPEQQFKSKEDLVQYLKQVTDEERKKLPFVLSLDENGGTVTGTKIELNDLTLINTYVVDNENVSKAKGYIELNTKKALRQLCPDLVAVKNFDVEYKFIYTDQNNKVFK